MKRNLLCIKKKENLDLGHKLLYEPYKNILLHFLELAIKRDATDFDPIAKVYDGLLSAPADIREYYESLLGVTSYYQHSRGGKGRYIEKKMASTLETCSLSIKISEIPIWLSHPSLHKKRGIFTLKGLSSEEKKLLRESEWSWLGDKDEESDLGNIIKEEKTIVLLEVKNRVDSGGTSARREIWTSQKFGIILDYFISEQKIYETEKGKFSIVEMFKSFDINTLELWIGILFDIGDRPANIEADKKNGFYSASKEGFKYLKEKISKSSKFHILKEDPETLFIEIKHVPSKMILRCGALYGDQVTTKLFRKEVPVADLLLLKYDDIWLSQLLAINERASLLKYGKNYTTILKNILTKNYEVRRLYNEFIDSEGCEDRLNELVGYLLKNFKDEFVDVIKPRCESIEDYLADVIQFLASAEA